jgi:hypothetical protein
VAVAAVGAVAAVCSVGSVKLASHTISLFHNYPQTKLLGNSMGTSDPSGTW